MEQVSTKVAPKNSSTIASSAVGRRKESVARVRLSLGNSPMTVNGKPINEYFTELIAQTKLVKPLEITQTVNKYTASIKVIGGGRASQLDAVIHGIARALNKVEDGSLRERLKKEGLLTRDARVKERRKYGNAQKARAQKQSPKR